jgi:hypothetical protein
MAARSLIRRDLANAQLHDLGADVPMEIRMYRSAKKSRKAVVKVWETAMALASAGGR